MMTDRMTDREFEHAVENHFDEIYEDAIADFSLEENMPLTCDEKINSNQPDEDCDECRWFLHCFKGGDAE